MKHPQPLSHLLYVSRVVLCIPLLTYEWSVDIYVKIGWYVILFSQVPEGKSKIYPNNSYFYDLIATGNALLFFPSPFHSKIQMENQ
jgi:hypothetical protein